MNTLRFTQTFIPLAIALIFAGLMVPGFAHAQTANECAFSRTLEMEVDGEDVRCLQKYLNSTGFVLAESGPGSVGNETSLYRTLTKEAVVRWQIAKGVSPASGVFGPKSQAAYLLSMISGLETQKDNQTLVTNTPTPQPIVAGAATSLQTEAEALLEEAFEAVKDAEDQIDEVDNAKDKLDFNDDLREVRKELYEALSAYFDKDYSEAKDLAESVSDDATEILEDALDAIDDRGDSLTDDLEDARDELDDAWDDFDAAEDDGDDVGDAEDLLEEAEDLLNDAEDAIDDEDYSEAEDLIDEALDEF